MERVVDFIRNYGSVDAPVTNHEIAAHLRKREVDIRKLINQARCEGYPICSCTKGYFYSTNKADIVETIHSLNSRTIAVGKAISGLLTNLNRVEDNEDD